MPKKPDQPLEPTTINLVQGDREQLQRFYGKTPYGLVIRTLVRNHVKKLLEMESRKGSSDVRDLAADVDLEGVAPGGGDADAELQLDQ